MATMDGGEKVRLSFERLHYTVNVKGSGLPKALLQNINGDVTSGHVLAILGPSGAGKTTLLNALTLQQAGGSPSGYIRVNGEPLTTDMYDRVCAYVEQFDTLWASLTAREHLEYAMALHRGDLDVTQRAAEVDKLLHSVGLEEFQHTRAGSEIIRGLSSGNKRRLSVALALVKRPKILFLDEPTSGVDSASAVRMMTFLKNVAREQNIAVACTIHQPPASVFAGFDNVMVLSMGRVAYFGKAAKMAAYLTGINNAPTADTNPAEFILDLVNKDFTSTASVKAVLDKWSEGTGEAYGCDMEKGDGKPLALADFQRAPFAKQLTVLTDRSVVVARREPLAYLVRLVANFNATLFFGIIYIETRDKVQAQINPRTFFLMFCVGIPMQFILVSNFIYHYQWLSLKKEVKDGMYHPAANAIASWIVQIPMMFILALSSLIPMFALGDLNWDSFGIVLVLYAVTFWAFEGLAQAFSTFPTSSTACSCSSTSTSWLSSSAACSWIPRMSCGPSACSATSFPSDGPCSRTCTVSGTTSATTRESRTAPPATPSPRAACAPRRASTATARRTRQALCATAKPAIRSWSPSPCSSPSSKRRATTRGTSASSSRSGPCAASGTSPRCTS